MIAMAYWQARGQWAALLVFCCLAQFAVSSQAAPSGELPVINHRLDPSFEANLGQYHQELRFAVNRHPYQAGLRGNKIALTLPIATARLAARDAKPELQPAARVVIEFLGANPEAVPNPEQLLAERSHYFLGSDPAKWITDVPHYRSVTFAAVYPGVDLRYYAKDGMLEYDLLVAPGAALKEIPMQIHGAERIELEKTGDLLIHAAGITLRQKKPLVYQERGGEKRSVAASYLPLPGHRLRLVLGQYDQTRPLVIDPILDFGAVYGGGVAALAATVDGRGNIYLAGATNWPGYPTLNPFDASHPGGHVAAMPIPAAFVTKLNATGTEVLYSTFLGGDGGASVQAIHVDEAGNVYLGGLAGNQFPTSSGAYLGAERAPMVPTLYYLSTQLEDSNRYLAFAAKLAPAGNALAYATYLAPVNRLTTLAVDTRGAAYLAGDTSANDFPTSPSALQKTLPSATGKRAGFLAKLVPEGSALAYASYYGGAGGDTSIAAVAVDALGNAHVTGATTSPSLPLAQPFQGGKRSGEDAFVAKFNAEGSAVLYASYLGGDGSNCMGGADFGTAIALDAAGYAYVAGRTYAESNFPILFGRTRIKGFVDAFVSKLSPTDGRLVQSVLLGGNDSETVSCGAGLGSGEHPRSLHVNADQTLTVAGSGASPELDNPEAGFPLVNPVATLGSGFVTTVEPTTLLPVFSTVFPRISKAATNRFGDIVAFGLLPSGWFLRRQEDAVPLTPGGLPIADPGGNVSYFARIIRPAARISLSSSPGIFEEGKELALRASLEGLGEAGTLEFFDGEAKLGAVTLSGDATGADFTIPSLTPGVHRYRARYSSANVPKGLASGVHYVTAVPRECN